MQATRLMNRSWTEAVFAAFCWAVTVTVVCILGAANAQVPTWKPAGPAPIRDGQIEGIANRPVVGAINALAPHPTDPNVIYVGAVNGGIWKTTNAQAPAPNWIAQTDALDALAIGALEFDPTDATNQTLVSGTGNFSSFGLIGARAGLVRTTDGGATWAPVAGAAALRLMHISGVAPRGSVIVVSNANATAQGGIWRSTDTGATWTQISGLAGTGLPVGRSFDLTGDPTNTSRLFTNGGLTGIYRSDDTGATWTKVSDAAMDTLIAGLGSGTNMEIAVGRMNNVYVAIVGGGRLAGVFRSPDGGATWVSMDLPAASEGGIHPGFQGALHLSIAADPTNPNLVYIGGDRQDFPNSFGAQTYSGRLFRGDASQPLGSQFVHLTHSRTVGPAGGGTIGNSSPHADSRDMKFSANGNLLEVDDGGIYQRTNPQTNNGDWFSLTGDLQVAEFHSVAWDSNSRIIIGGTQDNDTPQQMTSFDGTWRNVGSGDGGVVAVDDTTTPGFSTRYYSSQRLGGFRRAVYDPRNVRISALNPTLTVLDGGQALSASFYSPVKLNIAQATRLIIGGANSVYESLDQGDTIREVLTDTGTRVVANSYWADGIAYGAADNPDVLYVAASNRIYVRTAASPAPLVLAASYPGTAFIQGIAVDPANYRLAYVADINSVYQTRDAGATWTNITGNLPALNTGALRSLTYVATAPVASIAVGSERGVFAASAPTFNAWTALGSGLPRAPVLKLQYSKADNLILAGTLGRGSFTASLDAGGSGWTDDGTVVRLTSFRDRVGIGTSSPAGKLQIDVDNDGGSDLFVADVDAGLAKGYVGIGTKTPEYKLTVGDKGNLDAANYLQLNASTWAGILFSGGGRGADITYNHMQNYMRFETSTGDGTGPWERMRITSRGYVGLGTQAPDQRLTVGDRSTTDPANYVEVNGATWAGIVFKGGGRGADIAYNHPQNYMRFETSSGDGTGPWERMRITGNGNVGIGTVNPGTNRLAVEGDVEITGASPTLRVTARDEQPARLRFEDAQARTTEHFEVFFNASDQNLHFRSDEREMMKLTHDGLIYFTPKNLHTTHPSLSGSQYVIAWNQSGGRGETAFYQHGGGGWKAGYDFWSQRDGQSRRLLASLEDTGNLRLRGSVGSLSDARAKINVRAIADPLTRVLGLRGVSFDWKDEGTRTRPNIGFVAQDVIKVLPEVVTGGTTPNGEEELYSVHYDKIVPLLVEAIKEQQKNIDRLSRRVSELEALATSTPRR